MNTQQIQLVRSSFAHLAPIADRVAALFYQRLFERNPELRTMFRGDMQAQGNKLMQMIGAAVALLDQPEHLMPVLQKLGQRHYGYGVHATHYDMVGAALLQTLDEGLGPLFSAPVREAWISMYGLVASTMISAARQVEPAAA